MKRLITLALLASASAAALAAPAMAQPASGAGQAVSADEPTLGEIVVTARRKSESLQEVPQTVNAVTSDTLQKLNIRQFQDIQTVVPGLSLQGASSGSQSSASLRGVTFAVNTAAQPTVAFYLNDAPVQLGFIFQSLFDIGQVEVLKGPQGTTRGISAPSGAMTVTTRKPDLSEFGGYADVTANDLGARNAQGAINLPIVKDVLALRIAGVIDQNDYDGVRSIHNSLRPRSRTNAMRAGVSFEPSDRLNANITYQHLDHDVSNFVQVSGPGAGAFTLGTTVFPASVEPPLTPEMRAAVQTAANVVKTHYDVVTAQVDSRIFGQHLSYVGSYQLQKTNSVSEGTPGSSAGDIGDVLPGIAILQYFPSRQVRTTQEIRMASDPAPDRFFDYTVGAYYSWTSLEGRVVNPGPLLPGAFGTAPGINLAAFNPLYQVPVFIDLPSTDQETSLFGSLTLHLGPKTELSGGIRHIWSISASERAIVTGNGLLNLGAVGLPPSTPCSLLGATAGARPGDCVLPTGAVQSNLVSRDSLTPNIYNVSLSHHFSRNLLLYANTGTSFRPPVATPGIQGALVNSPNPLLSQLTFHPAESSRAYEVGFKSTWFDGRARLNASIFSQRFHDMTMFVPNIVYLNTITNQPTNFDFTTTVDALVQGFDVDTAFQLTPMWTVSAQMSYADGKVKNSLVPCNITGANGQPVFNTNGLISMCPGGSASRLPLWNATFQSEYTRPIADSMDGFARILATYYPQNKNRVEPNFTVPSYGLVNIYLGLRSHDGAWEASIFARNAFQAEQTLDLSPAMTNLNGSLGTAFSSLIHPTGYFQTLTTPRREVGINVHYAWGSR